MPGHVAQAGANSGYATAAPADKTAFLGLAETDMTPAVKGAVQTLLTEIDDLRGEVGRLKARLVEVEEQADRDPLVPVLNRRAFVRELSRIRTFSQGDAALQAVGERLTAQVRESDIVGRMGGDEFAVILVQADQATAEAKAQSLARAIEREPLQFGDWSAPIHISYGVRQISLDAEPEAIVAEADAAMYVKKREWQAQQQTG